MEMIKIMRRRTRRTRTKTPMTIMTMMDGDTVMMISNQRPDIVLEDPLIIKLPQVHINFQQCLPHLMITMTTSLSMK